MGDVGQSERIDWHVESKLDADNSVSEIRGDIQRQINQTVKIYTERRRQIEIMYRPIVNIDETFNREGVENRHLELSLQEKYTMFKVFATYRVYGRITAVHKFAILQSRFVKNQH